MTIRDGFGVEGFGVCYWLFFGVGVSGSGFWAVGFGVEGSAVQTSAVRWGKVGKRSVACSEP